MNTEITTLYSADKSKKIRYYSVSYRMGDTVGIVEINYGVLFGKNTTKSETFSKGNANRTILEQCKLKYQSLINEKLDEGYKTTNLIKEFIGKFTEQGNSFIQEELVDAPIQELVLKPLEYNINFYNTNKDLYLLPMLAHKYKDIKTKTWSYLGQPKLNGVRCTAQTGPIDRPGNSYTLVSRGGQYYEIPHIIQQLNKITTKVKEVYENHEVDIIFDGEIYKHGVSLQEISGAARKQVNPNDLFPSNNWLEFHIYDVILSDTFTSNNLGRHQSLLGIKAIINSLDVPNIKFVNTVNISNEDGLINHFNMCIELGYEGSILREMLNSPYEFNERSRSLLKYKEFKDEEFEITGFEGEGESFVFILRNNNGTDTTFKARPTGTIQEKEYWSVNINKLIGSEATVRYFERTQDGIPSHGNLRHDSLKIEHIRPYGE